MDHTSTRSAADYFPERLSLKSLQEAAAGCKGCDLYKDATQTVFGEGPRTAEIVFIGEQPGDQEDKAGHPFVGPAGELLNRALREAGIPRKETYVTNAVKHFKWVRRGRRRLHKKPVEREIKACSPWLIAELDLLRPQVVICLGTTAARAAFGKTVRLKDYRGSFTRTPLAAATFVTTHPSSLLRLRTDAEREREYQRLVEELKLVKSRLNSNPAERQDGKPRTSGTKAHSV